jgi:putative restriction endonuclease
MSGTEVIYGEIPGISEGAKFKDRRALHDANVHRGLMRGIAPGGAAIVLNEGYVDDEDLGDEIVYTGEGGRDANTGRQVRDQELTGGNLALARNQTEGNPVRVTRGPKLKSDFAPVTGYQYDGLYRVEEYWSDKGVDGYRIWRYRLNKYKSGLAAMSSDGLEATPSSDESQPERKTVEIARIVRDSKLARKVKRLYDFKCQACGTVLVTPVGKYAEGCHIRPLGKPHNGKDTLSNLLCFCANCHVLFDYHALIVLEDLTVSHTGAKLHTHPDHHIDPANLSYKRRLVQK